MSKRTKHGEPTQASNIEHGLCAGQKVVCISEDFPRIKKYGGSSHDAKEKPKKGEILVVDEVLGEFLRFDKYDADESFNWWMHDRFAPLNEYESSVEFLIFGALLV